MVKHTQTIPQLFPMNCLSVFGHFVGLVLKGLLFIDLITESKFSVIKGKTRSYLANVKFWYGNLGYFRKGICYKIY